ncbi:CU044_5270 family protein [Micromonospora sp. NPDC048839]|uniref:CU044_5270 family protein n=1 Tax=Micromonospora sp. NPDC048839 TaxID=3155641 RepID=UPI0033C03BAC
MSRTPQLGNFEARLLAELKEHLGARTTESAPAADAAPTTVRATRGARWRRPGWRLAGVGGLVVLLTAAGLVTQTVGDTPPTASAAEILTEAADTARQQPDLVARPGQFLFVELRLTSREEPAAGPYVDERLQRWVPVGDDPTWQQRRRLESRPDEWRTDHVSHLPPPPGYFQGLPTEPEQMAQHLRDHPIPLDLPAGADLEAIRNDPTTIFGDGMWMLQGYVPPQSLGALFQAMARVPGASVLPGEVRDAAGRRGVALRTPGVFAAHVDLIFDRETHVYLGTRQLTVRDGKESPYTSTAIMRMAIVDRSGQLP